MLRLRPKRSRASGGFGSIKFLIFCLIVVGNIANFWDGMESPREIGPPRTEGATPAPGSDAQGPAVIAGRTPNRPGAVPDPRLEQAGPVVSVGSSDAARGVSTGTAFPVDDAGHYLTARHVIERCRTVGLFVSDRKVSRVQVAAVHGEADVALLRASSSPDTPFPLVRDLQAADLAYSVGYPEGRAGGTRLSFLGTARIRGTGRFKSREGALYWAATTRVPRRLQTLGGHSGGPVFDDAGRVIGILVAGEDRRGRVLTSRPRIFNAVVDGVGLEPSGREAVTFRQGRLNRIVSDMTGTKRVRKVYCKR